MRLRLWGKKRKEKKRKEKRDGKEEMETAKLGISRHIVSDIFCCATCHGICFFNDVMCPSFRPYSTCPVESHGDTRMRPFLTSSEQSV